MTLAVEHATKRFEGLVAVSDVSFELRSGETLGLIGPNGSGKTTLFNLISGVFPPDSGRITLEGRELTARPPYAIARAGIGRTHQIVQPLTDLSVRDNVAVGACFGRRNLPLARAYEVADRVLEEVALVPKRHLSAGKLNIAEKKRLELARALAGEPLVLLLDEVLAGLNPTEVGAMLDVIRAVHRRGIDVIMVEHIMQAIMNLCDRIVVLESGRVIAQGSGPEVANDPRVITAYLGDPKLVAHLRGQG
ncbi:MAG: ABC transporter ATP-binding protein [Chloroflexi bacterium]|nr:ABC transporter ATP-binding protein [Chloroflexota bacterium]